MPLSHGAREILKLMTSVDVRSEVTRELAATDMLNTSLRSTLWNPEKTLQTDPVLRHVLAQDLPGAPPPPPCPSFTTLNASCGSHTGYKQLPPTLLLMHMPWFDVHTGHARTWALLHVLQYRCLFELYNMRMVVMVQPGELAKCQKICRPSSLVASGGTTRRFCRCHEAEHDRAYQQRNVAEFCKGNEHILYAHADTFLNLPLWARKIAQYGNHTMMPSSGLDGTNYAPTPSACVPATERALNASNRWWWHLDAKPKCRAAAESLSASALGGASGAKAWHAQRSCCYGWVDVACALGALERASSGRARTLPAANPPLCPVPPSAR